MSLQQTSFDEPEQAFFAHSHESGTVIIGQQASSAVGTMGTGKKIFKGARLIDGVSQTPAERPLVTVEGNKISEITTWDPAAPLTPQPGSELVDASFCTLMPGMIDCHIHLAAFNVRTFDDFRVGQWELTPELQQMYALFHAQLCFERGFTTLRDVGWSATRGLLTSEMCAIRDAINGGLFAGPRLKVAGWTMITGAHLDLLFPRAAQRSHDETADGPWELRKLARKNLRTGCDLLKTCVSGGGGTDKEEPTVRNMTAEELFAVVDEAHAFHKSAAVHCFTPDAQRMAIAAGADTIEHMVFTDDDAIERIVAAGKWVIPTLTHRTDHAIEVRRKVGGTEYSLAKMKKIQPFCFETFRRMHQAGVKIALGTDISYDPEMGSNATELEIYVSLGMSPMEAIQSATSRAAEAIGINKEVGTLAPGKLADILAVDGDPLSDIRILQDRKRMALVIKDGHICIDRRPGFCKEVIHPEPDTWRLFGV
jgi:imidazolonepropionase-like amidohydrolase